jgi:hypothetical protein
LTLVMSWSRAPAGKAKVGLFGGSGGLRWSSGRCGLVGGLGINDAVRPIVLRRRRPTLDACGDPPERDDAAY